MRSCTPLLALSLIALVGCSSSADTTDPAQLKALNGQLATMGPLHATGINPEGYPILDIDCNDAGDCYDSNKRFLGDIHQVAAFMPPVRGNDRDILKYHCMFICMDSNGDFVGANPDQSPHDQYEQPGATDGSANDQ